MMFEFIFTFGEAGKKLEVSFLLRVKDTEYSFIRLALFWEGIVGNNDNNNNNSSSNSSSSSNKPFHWKKNLPECL